MGVAVDKQLCHTQKFEKALGNAVARLDFPLVCSQLTTTASTNTIESHFKEPEYGIHNIAEDHRPAFQRKWIGKCVSHLLMASGKASELNKLIQQLSISKANIVDTKSLDTLQFFDRLMQPLDVGCATVLKDTLTHCLSPFFLFQAPFQHRATCKSLQSAVESARLTLLKDNSVHDIGCPLKE